MGLLTKTVKIQPKGSQIKYFKNLGYQFKKNEEIEVKVEDLTKGSHVLVECQCDYCNNYVYDENDETYYCVVDMDEDDYGRLMSGARKTCPYYTSNNEYEVVKHQM